MNHPTIYTQEPHSQRCVAPHSCHAGWPCAIRKAELEAERQRRAELKAELHGGYCMRHGTPGQFCDECADEADRLTV